MHAVVAWHGNCQYYGTVIIEIDTLSVNPILNIISTNFVILKHYADSNNGGNIERNYIRAC